MNERFYFFEFINCSFYCLFGMNDFIWIFGFYFFKISNFINSFH